MCCVLVRPLTQSLVINKSEEQITHKPEGTQYLHSVRPFGKVYVHIFVPKPD